MDQAYRKPARLDWREKPIGPPRAALAPAGAASAIDREIRRLARQCARLHYQWEHGLVPSPLPELEEEDGLTEREVSCGPAILPPSRVPARAAA